MELAARAGMIGVALGLLAARGAFRRSRNGLTPFLGDEHAAYHHRAVRWQRSTRAQLVLALVPNLLWTPGMCLAILYADRPADWKTNAALAGTGPLPLLAIIAHALALRKERQRLGFTLPLTRAEDHLVLTIDSPEYARLVAAHANVKVERFPVEAATGWTPSPASRK